MSQFAHLYHTQRWRKLSLAHRAKEPLCRMCKEMGRIEVGKITDHRNGHPEGETEAQFWAGPFDTLCATHHESTKKRMEGKGAVLVGCDPDGWPVASQEEMPQIR